MAELPYVKFIQEGSNYEIGLERGKFIADIPDLKAVYCDLPEGTQKFDSEEFERRITMLEKACPGVKDELRGIADGAGVHLDELALMRSISFERPRSCGLVAVPPSFTTDGHTYFARSYEYNYEDELIFSVTRVPGKYAHMGFSLFHVGRFDGMNEKGLCAGMASCECVCSSAQFAEGVEFPIVLRRILDDCSTVEEALNRMETLPFTGNYNYLFADSSGDMAVVETLCSESGCSRVIRRSDGPLYAFNHYISDEHRAAAPSRKWFSTIRQQYTEEFLSQREKISRDDMFKLLSEKLPNGLCCSAYNDYFGTLHSSLFDATDKRLWVCFGSPKHNQWFEADLNAPAGCEVFMVECPNEDVPYTYWQEA